MHQVSNRVFGLELIQCMLERFAIIAGKVTSYDTYHYRNYRHL